MSQKNEFNTRVGAAVRSLRKARGMTTEGFAPKIGLARSTLSGIENGYKALTPEVAVRAAAVLGCTIEELFDGSGLALAKAEILRELDEVLRLIAGLGQTPDGQHQVMQKINTIKAAVKSLPEKAE